jgi:hypothetical protein
MANKETLRTVATRLEGIIFSQTDKEAAIQTLVSCLSANTIVRGTSRTASGSPIYVERPDNAIRLAAAVKIIEWEAGKPHQILDVRTPPTDSARLGMQDLAKMVNEQPAIFDKVLQAMREGAKVAQAIDVTSTSKATTA